MSTFPRFICPQCRSNQVRPILVMAATLRLLCDECDHEWEIPRPSGDPPKVRP